MPDLVAAARDVAGYADRWLAFRRDWLRVPGVQAAVWADGDLALAVAHGAADVAAEVAITPAHLFRIASHSKSFTATAVVQLAEAGRLGLDDRVDRHVPWTAEAGVGDRALADLLGHGGGVLRDGREADHWQLVRPFPDGDGLRALAVDGAVCGADERFKYSNVAFGLLGAVVAAVTGRSYRDHVAEAVIAPLGLTDTSPDLVVERLSDYACGYTARGYAERRVPIEMVDTGALDAATGFTSTAADLARWGAAHLPGDERLLGAAWQRRMRRPGFDVDEHDADAGRYGLGFDLRTVHGRRTFGHGGGYPGHATRLTVLPEDRLSVAVCTNAVDGPARPLADGLVALAVLAAGEPDGAPVDATADRYAAATRRCSASRTSCAWAAGCSSSTRPRTIRRRRTSRSSPTDRTRSASCGRRGTARTASASGSPSTTTTGWPRSASAASRAGRSSAWRRSSPAVTRSVSATSRRATRPSATQRRSTTDAAGHAGNGPAF